MVPMSDEVYIELAAGVIGSESGDFPEHRLASRSWWAFPTGPHGAMPFSEAAYRLSGIPTRDGRNAADNATNFARKPKWPKV